MCCYTGRVKEVSGTRIFARAGEGNSQFIVYEMRVKAKEPVAMVLPLPVEQSKGEKAVRFIDLKEYSRFFDDLQRAFIVPSKGDTRMTMGMAGAPTVALPVQRVGAFD